MQQRVFAVAIAALLMAGVASFAKAATPSQDTQVNATVCSLDQISTWIGVNPGSSPFNPDDLKLALRRRLNACQNLVAKASRFAEGTVLINTGVSPPETCSVEGAPPAEQNDILYLFDKLEFCVYYNTLIAAVSLPSPLFHATQPTYYVILNSAPASSATGNASFSGGGGSSSQSSGHGSGSTSGSGSQSPTGASTSASGNGNGSGSANAPTVPAASGATGTTTGTIDNPSALLLYDIAIRLSPPIAQSENNAFIVPATQWTLANFYNQCLADPPQIDKSTGAPTSGTAGALVIDESTTTNSGSFALVILNGWTRVKYSVAYYRCQNLFDPKTDQAASGRLPAQLGWRGSAEGADYRNGVSFLPIAGYFTFLSTKWYPSTSASGVSSTIQYASPANYVLAYLLPSLTSVTIGDTGLTMTVPRAYDRSTEQLAHQISTELCGVAANTAYWLTVPAQAAPTDTPLCHLASYAADPPAKFATQPDAVRYCKMDTIVWLHIRSRRYSDVPTPAPTADQNHAYACKSQAEAAGITREESS